MILYFKVIIWRVIKLKVWFYMIISFLRTLCYYQKRCRTLAGRAISAQLYENVLLCRAI